MVTMSHSWAASATSPRVFTFKRRRDIIFGMCNNPAHDDLAEFATLGELSLDGGLNPVAGVLPAAMVASGADLGLICPASQGGEAASAGRA